MLLSFNNVENEMNFAFRNIRDNQGSDIFTLCVYAVVNMTLINNIMSTVGAPAWIYIVFNVSAVFAMVGIYFLRIYLSENSIRMYHLFDTVLQAATAIVITSAGPLQHQYLNAFSQETLFHLCMCQAYFTRSIGFRVILYKIFTVSLSWLVTRVFTYNQDP